MTYERKHNWRAFIKQIDPEAERRIGEFVSMPRRTAIQ